MNPLAAHQRTLLRLIKDRPIDPGGDQYLAQVARSPQLQLVREIVRWWREVALERCCPLTWRLLRRRCQLDSLLAEFVRSQQVSPYKEQASVQFLEWLVASPLEPTLACVAQLEAAVLRVAQGSLEEFNLEWDAHPDEIARCLLEDRELPAPDPRFVYRMTVAAALPGGVACVAAERTHDHR